MSDLTDRLDQMGINSRLEPGELVSDAIVVMKVITAEGEPYVYLTNSDGLDWITAIGMMNVATDQISGGMEHEDDD